MQLSPGVRKEVNISKGKESCFSNRMGLMNLPHLHRCERLAVVTTAASFDASHLWQIDQSQNVGLVLCVAA